MPRDAIPCAVQDLSAFAKTLRSQLQAHVESAAEAPSHLTLMNMLARAAGHRNLQALKASHAAQPGNSHGQATLPARQRAQPAHGPRLPGLSETADRALRQFDEQGRLARWPTKYSVQRHAMWGLWMHFDAKRPYTEREVNEILKSRHSFGDHCTLRRELVNMRLLERTADGACYHKVAARPDADVAALLKALRLRG